MKINKNKIRGKILNSPVEQTQPITGGKAQINPWGKGATTFEWKLSSPPPFHSFDDLPKVK